MDALTPRRRSREGRAVADDGQLLEAWRAGDRKAGERLFDRHYASVARFFRNKAFEEADDLVQQAFLACVGGKDRFEGRSSFRSYLFGVCHNVLKTHYRKARQQRERIEWGHVSVQDLAPGMSTMMGRKAEEQMTLMALRQLSVEDQVIMEDHANTPMVHKELNNCITTWSDCCAMRQAQRQIKFCPGWV